MSETQTRKREPWPDKRPVLIGQAPAANSLPDDMPFEGRTGRTLCASAGWTLRGLGEFFDLRNVLDRWPGPRVPNSKRACGDAFPMDLAVPAAAKLAAELEGRNVILAGRGVAAAFGVPDAVPYLEWRDMDLHGHPARVAVMPHPSGTNRWWCQPGRRVQAGNFLRAAVGMPLRRGRPTRLDAALGDAICDAVSVGVPVWCAAQNCNVAGEQLDNWRDFAEQGREPYATFFARLAKAEAEAEVRMVAAVAKAAQAGDARAAEWWLERRRPEDWARRPDVAAIQVNIGTSDMTRAAGQLQAIVGDVGKEAAARLRRALNGTATPELLAVAQFLEVDMQAEVTRRAAAIVDGGARQLDAGPVVTIQPVQCDAK